MPRTRLKETREQADMTQGELAQRIESVRQTVSAWEQGHQHPQSYYRKRIRKVLDSRDRNLFALDGQSREGEEACEIDEEEKVTPPCQTIETQDRINSSEHIDVPASEEELSMDPKRRAITQTLGVGGLTLVSNVGIVSNPIIAPELSLQAARGVVKLGWDMMSRGNCDDAKTLLDLHIPALDKMATTVWQHQNMAAGLAVQAQIMYIWLANRTFDYETREYHCGEAIRFAQLTGNPDILAAAQYWYGDTYTYCYNQPQQAIDVFNIVLGSLNSDSSPLVRTALLSNLSVAHAQMGDEKARDYAEQARLIMQQQPELDPIWKYIWKGHAELNQSGGKAYLHLAEHFPGSKYAQQACDAFEQSLSQQAQTIGYRVQALTRKADAARLLGDMDECVNCSAQAYQGALSLKRFTEISKVLDRVPDTWKNETSVQQLQKDVSHALVVARGAIV